MHECYVYTMKQAMEHFVTSQPNIAIKVLRASILGGHFLVQQTSYYGDSKYWNY